MYDDDVVVVVVVVVVVFWACFFCCFIFVLLRCFCYCCSHYTHTHTHTQESFKGNIWSLVDVRVYVAPTQDPSSSHDVAAFIAKNDDWYRTQVQLVCTRPRVACTNLIGWIFINDVF